MLNLSMTCCTIYCIASSNTRDMANLNHHLRILMRLSSPKDISSLYDLRA